MFLSTLAAIVCWIIIGRIVVYIANIFGINIDDVPDMLFSLFAWPAILLIMVVWFFGEFMISPERAIKNTCHKYNENKRKKTEDRLEQLKKEIEELSSGSKTSTSSGGW